MVEKKIIDKIVICQENVLVDRVQWQGSANDNHQELAVLGHKSEDES